MKTQIFSAIILFCLFFTPSMPAQTWEQTNGPFGGFIHSLARHPSGEIYAGIREGGLFRSTDEGDTWFNVGFKGRSVRDIFIAPSGNIFITTEYIGISQSGHYTWLTEPYRSTDNGTTWNLVNLLDPFEIITCWSSDDFGNIYLVTGHLNPFEFNILKSSDNGETWEYWAAFNYGYPNDLLIYDSYIFLSDWSHGIWMKEYNYWVLRFSPSNGYGTSCILRTSAGVLLTGTGQGVFMSLDNAVTWDRIYSGGIENASVTSITEDSNGNLFASTQNAGVFKSEDQGLTWVQMGLQDYNIYTIVTTASNYLIAGSAFSLYRWNQSIQDFEEINYGIFVNKTLSLVYNNISDIVFAATSTGIFRTTDNGNVWQLIFRPFSEGWGYSEYPDRSITKFPLLFDDKSSTLFLKDDYDSLYSSTDNGTTWRSSYIPHEYNFRCLVSGFRPGEIFGSGIDYSGSKHSAFFYSSDFGRTWVSTNLNVPSNPPVQCLAINELYNYIFACTDGNGIYRSTDNGSSWRAYNVGLLNKNLQSIVINSEGNLFIGTQAGVFRSRDQGGNWSSAGLVNDTILTLTRNSIGDIFAGTQAGNIYKSIDEGDSWFNLSSGLNQNAVRCIAITNDDFALAGTVSDGVFRAIPSTVGVDNNNIKVPTDYLLSQNYPNPFNPSTKIKYSVPQTSNVQIKIFDVMGKQIETLVNKEKPAGTYELTWNAANLPSGVYFYQIKADSYVETKKMILLK